jgi:hypothetical protein
MVDTAEFECANRGDRIITPARDALPLSHSRDSGTCSSARRCCWYPRKVSSLRPLPSHDSALPLSYGGRVGKPFESPHASRAVRAGPPRGRARSTNPNCQRSPPSFAAKRRGGSLHVRRAQKSPEVLRRIRAASEVARATSRALPGKRISAATRTHEAGPGRLAARSRVDGRVCCRSCRSPKTKRPGRSSLSGPAIARCVLLARSSSADARLGAKRFGARPLELLVMSIEDHARRRGWFTARSRTLGARNRAVNGSREKFFARAARVVRSSTAARDPTGSGRASSRSRRPRRTASPRSRPSPCRSRRRERRARGARSPRRRAASRASDR